MKKIICILLPVAAVFLTSCATAGALVKTHIANPDSTLAALNQNDYIVLGQVSGTGTIIAADKEITQERETLSAGQRPAKDIILEGDTLRYGYLNNTSYPVQTAEEKALGNATYNMIEQALYNNADAVICVKTRMSVIPVINGNGSRNMVSPKSKITVKITGIAVKIKDTGTGIKDGTGDQEDLDPEATIKAQKEAEKNSAAESKTESKAVPDNMAAATETTNDNTQTDAAAAADNTLTDTTNTAQ
ncbi:MAG: hypothetical protein M0P01_07895 [Treponema sp.]|nr:hypothetical protein [Treponema sp.]